MSLDSFLTEREKAMLFIANASSSVPVTNDATLRRVTYIGGNMNIFRLCSIGKKGAILSTVIFWNDCKYVAVAIVPVTHHLFQQQESITFLHPVDAVPYTKFYAV